MPKLLSRREILAASMGLAASATAGSLILPAAAASPLRLTAGSRTLDVNGKAASVFGLTGPEGRPGLTLGPGERFALSLTNDTMEPTIIHWHGQLPPWRQDGFPWAETPPLPAGTTQAYDFEAVPGTFWMHSHQRMQEQVLMSAPLIVHSATDRQADRQEVILFLHDFSFRSPEEILTGLKKGSLGQAMASPAGVRATNMGGMARGGMSTGPGFAPDLNDVDYDAFLANDRTLADPEVIRVEPQGRVRLRIINGASASQFWIDLGALRGTVVAVDGHDVEPVSAQRVPISMAQRVDILLDLTASGAFPIVAQVEGKRDQTGVILATQGAAVPSLPAYAETLAPPVDLSLEKILRAATPLTRRPVDVVYRVNLSGSMSPYAWSMNGEYWPKNKPLIVASGQRVALDMVNQSMMAHPMHLHGHAFQVTALNGLPIAGAVRDTVLVPPMGSVRVTFDANNPGRWAYHCHNLYHMMTGMMAEVRYPGTI